MSPCLHGFDANVESALDDFKFNEALSYIWEVIRMTNKYVEESAPWNLAKDETKKDYLANVMYISFQSYYIRLICKYFS